MTAGRPSNLGQSSSMAGRAAGCCCGKKRNPGDDPSRRARAAAVAAEIGCRQRCPVFNLTPCDRRWSALSAQISADLHAEPKPPGPPPMRTELLFCCTGVCPWALRCSRWTKVAVAFGVRSDPVVRPSAASRLAPQRHRRCSGCSLMLMVSTSVLAALLSLEGRRMAGINTGGSSTPPSFSYHPGRCLGSTLEGSVSSAYA